MKTQRQAITFFTHWQVIFILVIGLCGWGNSLSAQRQGFKIPPGQKKMEVPFRFQNGFIIINVVFNGVIPMQFVFDTGAEYTILTKKEFAEILGVRYSKEFKILGSDMAMELTAYLSRGVSFQYKDFVAEKQDIFVLEDDYFSFDKFTGENIHGIIGASFFRNLVVEIDYRKQVLTFHDPDYFSMDKRNGFVDFDISISKGKPYLNCELEMLPGSALPIKLLIDTGASLGLLLHSDSTSILKTPANAIPGQVGNGLGGELMGFMGRINRLQLKEFYFNGFISSFQEINTSIDTSFLNGRNGLIGNFLLSRFVIVIDYINQKMYLKSRSKYNRGFKYDHSGLNIIASGAYLDQFVVQNVMSQSPADLAGLKTGDEVLSFNRLHRLLLSLERINNKLQRKPGKKIRVKIKRGAEKMVVKFKLKELI